MTKTIKLSKKITVAGVETDKIELREITTRDIRALGMPVVVKADGLVDMNMDVCGKYISRLSNLTDGDVDNLPVEDFINLGDWFFRSSDAEHAEQRVAGLVYHLHLSPMELLNMPVGELNWLYDQMCKLSDKQERDMNHGQNNRSKRR